MPLWNFAGVASAIAHHERASRYCWVDQLHRTRAGADPDRYAGAKLMYLASGREELSNLADAFPQLIGRLPERQLACKPIDSQAMANRADVAFLCLPQKVAMAQDC